MRRTHRFMTIGCLALALLVLAGCGSGTDTPTPTNEAQPTTTAPVPTTSPPPALVAPCPAPATVTVTVPAPSEPTSAPREPVQAACDAVKGWNTQPEEMSSYIVAEVKEVRVGRHGCFDRIVIDIEGTAPAGFKVGYVPAAQLEGSGRPLEVTGEAVLQVIVHAPATKLGEPGKVLHPAPGLQDWQSLREITFAGTFEGQSTFAVGVSAKRPFAVSTGVQAGQHSQVVVDIAH